MEEECLAGFCNYVCISAGSSLPGSSLLFCKAQQTTTSITQKAETDKLQTERSTHDLILNELIGVTDLYYT